MSYECAMRVSTYGTNGDVRHVNQASSRITTVPDYEHIINHFVARLRREEAKLELDPMSDIEIRLKAAGMAQGRVSSLSFFHAHRDLKRMKETKNPPRGKQWVVERDTTGEWHVVSRKV